MSSPLLLWSCLQQHHLVYLFSINIFYLLETGNSLKRHREEWEIHIYSYKCKWGFTGGSDDKESACNAGDLGLIPGLGRSLEKGMGTHSHILALRIHEQRSLAGYIPRGHRESDTIEWPTLTITNIINLNTDFSILTT